MKHAYAIVLALALLVVPAAGATGLSIGYTVTAGTAGDNGWYRSAVTVEITVQGAASKTCPDVATFATSAVELHCSASDGTPTDPPVKLDLQFKIDTDAPVVTGVAPSRAADANGWFNRPVSIAFSGTDTTSGIASCDVVSYSGPDSASAAASGTCRDNAGNTSAVSSFPLKYDATAPSVSASAARAADGGGWYSHPVTVSFAGSDGTSQIDSCSAPVTYSGPDTAGTPVGGSCVDRAGNSSSASLPVKYDATAPSVRAKLARAPDRRGWYTRPVTVTFSGSDALSGLAGCGAPKAYSGPDDGSARATGVCRDNAGNVAVATASLKYDATAPRLQDVAVAPGPGDVTLTWRQPADVTSVAVTRWPGRDGRDQTVVYKGRATKTKDTGLRAGVTYRYRLTSLDEAGNSATVGVTAKLRALYEPSPGSTVQAGAALRWFGQKDASYYNLQLYRGNQKVLSVWPVGTSFKLLRSWAYSGAAYRLTPGRYRWYVWPAHGTRTNAQYGALLGGSFFTVR